MQTQTRAWVTRGDKNLIYRVVGFLEYSSALKYLDELVQHSSGEELKAIDQLIRERPEYAVHTNLALGLLSRPSTVLPVGGSDEQERRGLPWVLALARVELGAILATFDGNPDAFAITRPSKLEWNAYRDLLTDDAQAHFWSLTRDPNLARVTKSTPDTPMLAYIRRLTLARQLLIAAAKSRGNELTPPQLAELTEQDEQLSQLRGAFRLTLANYLAANTGRTKSISKLIQHGVEACDIQLNHEAEELAKGKAHIEKVSPGAPSDQQGDPQKP